MHQGANTSHHLCTLFGMPRRRLMGKSEKARRHVPQSTDVAAPPVVIREASRVVRLAYTRSQAAEALGIGCSTFIRRVLPLVETIDMPWGARLIPVDELERLLDERRREASAERRPKLRRGRKTTVPAEIVARIRSERADRKSFGEIARQLNADGIETAQGGREWWPSTVRAVLVRSNPLKPAGRS
jgi:hypothetical protein